MRNTISLFDVITVLLVGYTTVSSVYPPLRAIMKNNTLLVAASMMLWVLLTFLKMPSFYLRPTMHRLITLVFILYSFIAPHLFGHGVIGNRYLAISPLFFLYVVYEYNSRADRGYNNIRIIRLTIPFVVLTLIRTGMGLMSNPFLSRSIKSSGEYSRDLWRQGIGGYEFIYFLALLFPVLIYLMFYADAFRKKHHERLVGLFGLSVLAVIVLSNYFTALIAVLLSVLTMIVIRVIDRRRYFAITALLLSTIIFLLVGTEIVVHVLDLMSVWVGGGLTAKRLMEARYAIVFGNDQIVRTSRWDLIRVSVQSFFQNPFFGTIGNRHINVLSFEVGAGQHSHIIDTFAFFGFIPGLMQIYIIVQPYFKRLRTGVARELMASVLVSIAIIFSLNTVTPSMGIVVSLIVPSLYDVLEIQNREYHLERTNNARNPHCRSG